MIVILLITLANVLSSAQLHFINVWKTKSCFQVHIAEKDLAVFNQKTSKWIMNGKETFLLSVSSGPAPWSPQTLIQ
jgi:hypothetical protein